MTRRDSIMWRVLAGVMLAVLVVGTLVAVPPRWGSGASAALVLPTTTVGEQCEEDEPCWNPCTMGVDGTYPESDPRHHVPGPCELSTPLPYGARFAVQVRSVDPGPGVECGQYWAHVDVVVTVVASDRRTVVSSAESPACVPVASPLGGGARDVLPDLFRSAARAMG